MTVVQEQGSTSAPQSRNHLLAVLPRDEFLQLRPLLTTVRLPAREILAEADARIRSVYFPLDTVISVTAAGHGSAWVEVGSVGCEGIAGLPVLFGSDRSPSRLLVQIAGQAERLDADAVPDAVQRLSALRRLLLLYAQGFVTQISQSTVCSRLHAAEQRLARWILICRDRVGRDEIPVTHETMSTMLGVRRATVTEAAGALQREGLIRYRRGVVAVVDRGGLEAAACVCYRIVREEFNRLLGVRVG